MNSTEERSGLLSSSLDIFQIVWLCGIAVSFACLLMQFTFFGLIRSCRKTDEKILIQITVTRILNTLCEYYLLYLRNLERCNCLYPIFTLYFITDFALVVWMLVFTKNLYDKIVIVFPINKINLILTSVFVWTLSLPFGLIGLLFLREYFDYFHIYCRLVYAFIKCVIVVFNILIYVKIFYVAIKRGSESSKRNALKSAFVAFLLITTTCLQVLVTDLISYVSGKGNMALVKVFCVINSFHSVFITIIFVIILRGRLRESICKTVMIRLAELYK